MRVGLLLACSLCAITTEGYSNNDGSRDATICYNNDDCATASYCNEHGMCNVVDTQNASLIRRLYAHDFQRAPTIAQRVTRGVRGFMGLAHTRRTPAEPVPPAESVTPAQPAFDFRESCLGADHQPKPMNKPKPYFHLTDCGRAIKALPKGNRPGLLEYFPRDAYEEWLAMFKDRK